MAFTAQYAGTCDSCEEPIRPGQSVRYTAAGDVVHAGCADGDPRLVTAERVEETCTDCWLIKPCPCDDERRER